MTREKNAEVTLIEPPKSERKEDPNQTSIDVKTVAALLDLNDADLIQLSEDIYNKAMAKTEE